MRRRSSRVSVSLGAVSVSTMAATADGWSRFATTATAGTIRSVTVAAKDSLGNTATGATGTVHFTSTDGAAAPSADSPLAAGDAGAHTFTSGVTLGIVGSRSVTFQRSQYRTRRS